MSRISPITGLIYCCTDANGRVVAPIRDAEPVAAALTVFDV
jgi:hypothetical protein